MPLCVAKVAKLLTAPESGEGKGALGDGAPDDAGFGLSVLDPSHRAGFQELQLTKIYTDMLKDGSLDDLVAADKVTDNTAVGPGGGKPGPGRQGGGSARRRPACPEVFASISLLTKGEQSLHDELPRLRVLLSAMDPSVSTESIKAAMEWARTTKSAKLYKSIAFLTNGLRVMAQAGKASRGESPRGQLATTPIRRAHPPTPSQRSHHAA